MKKRLLALLLCVSLLLSGSALALSNSADNFVRSKTYSGQFSDLSDGSAFCDNIRALYEYGLSVGRKDGTFGLAASIRVGEVLVFAARIRSLYQFGDAEAGAAAFRQDGQDIYVPYLLYLKSEGVLGNELDALLYQAATRAQVAHVLADTLPASVLPAVNDELVTQAYASRQFIPDVTEYTEYYGDILTLYKCGVLAGSDKAGSFHPDAQITRGAAAAMLTRMVDPDLRVTPDWTIIPDYSAHNATWGSLIPGSPTYLAAPSAEEEIGQDVDYILSQESNVLELNYGGRITYAFVYRLMNSALATVKEDCEQLYNYVSCSYSLESGYVRLSFSVLSQTANQAVTADQLATYRADTLKDAIRVHDALWAAGQITDNMTQYQKAKVFYTWICQNCVYDYSATENSLSHTAYALFENGTAVCDGYTGAYNLLLKLEGIDCTALSNDEHIWTVATLDGTVYHIDTTWGDSGSSINYTYFGMSAQQSMAYHPWQ